MAETATAPQPDPGGPTGPGTSNTAAEQLAKSAQPASIINDPDVDLDDEASARTLDQKAEQDKAAQPQPPVRADFDPTRIKFPDDFKVPAGDPTLSEFSDITKKHGLPQDAAQEYVDLYAKTVKKAADQPYQMWRDTHKGWQDEVMSDPELGGKNFDNVRRVIGSALTEYGDPKVRTALDFTGAGNNPAIIRTMYRMARALAEPGPVSASPPTRSAPDSPGAALYPHLIKNRGDG
jgi:hypothetical protein